MLSLELKCVKEVWACGGNAFMNAALMKGVVKVER